MTSSCVDLEHVTACDAFIEHSLALIRATHLPRFVVHLLAVALWAVFLHYDLGHLSFLLLALRVLHPLLPLGEALLGHDLSVYEVLELSLVLTEAACHHRGVGLECEHHSAVRAKDRRGEEGDKRLDLGHY